MLFRGQQGVFRFLGHCSSVLFIKNEADVAQFFQRRHGEVPDPLDQLWVEQNRYAVCQAMIGLFHRLTGRLVNDVVRIASTIEEWTFAIQQTTREEMGEPEASVMSMVNDGPTDSFIETRKRIVNSICDRPAKRRYE